MTERAFAPQFLLRLGGIAWRGYTQHGRGYVVLDPPRYWARFDVPTEVLVRLTVADLIITERYEPRREIVVLDLAACRASLITPPEPPPQCKFVTAPLDEFGKPTR